MTALLPSQILDAAADLVVRDGWAREDWFIPFGDTPPGECRKCAAGAINTASGLAPDDEEHDDASRLAALRTLALRVDAGVREADDRGWAGFTAYVNAVAEWNDEPGRTAEQVVAALRSCARELREAGR
ncbi:DUF6197 family protein [Spirillospora sp. CA-253888]